MNLFITAVTSLDVASVREFLKEPKWRSWAEPNGKAAVHYLCGVNVGSSKEKSVNTLAILKLLLENGSDINSVHRVEDKNCDVFPATPLWYAYTRGRNEKIYKYLLKNGADPSHCWWAIAWYDDVTAAELWLKHGAKIDKKPSLGDLFVGSFYAKKMKFAKWALAHGADINTRGPGGITALMVAVKRKAEESIKWLITNGADPDIKDEKGMSARETAETKGPRRLLDLLGVKRQKVR